MRLIKVFYSCFNSCWQLLPEEFFIVPWCGGYHFYNFIWRFHTRTQIINNFDVEKTINGLK